MPDCRREMSDAALACPQCGRPALNVLGREKAIAVKVQEPISCVTIGCASVLAIVLLGMLVSWLH